MCTRAHQHTLVEKTFERLEMQFSVVQVPYTQAARGFTFFFYSTLCCVCEEVVGGSAADHRGAEQG